MNKALSFINIVLVILLSFSVFFHTNTSFDQDLGRHIKLGEIIYKTGYIPTTNLFTYTNSNYPFVNHHWLSEVIFYLLSSHFGLVSISILKILILMTALVITLYLTSKISHLNAALISYLLFIPLLIARTDERPEIFGLLLFSSLLFIYLYLANKNVKWLYIVPLIQMFWVNLHITFIYGYLLIFVLSIVCAYKNRNNRKIVFTTLGMSFFSGLINPHFFNGLIYPLEVFGNYGYSIVENQNLFYLSSLISNIFINYFWVVSIIGGIFITYALCKKYYHDDLAYILLYSAFFVVSIQMFRNFPFFSIVGIICMGYFIAKVFSKKHIQSSQTSLLITFILLMFCYQIISGNFYKTFDINKEFGLKINETYKNSAIFFKKNHLQGPIFNNFDIGGYLDYSLYPETKAYVDNRPEAFPVNFFDEYKAQYDLDNIKFIFNKYKIHSIIYSYTDGTQWASEFLKQIKNLPEYKLIYFDTAVVIYEKNSQLQPITDSNIVNVINNTYNARQLMNTYQYLTNMGKTEIADLALGKAYRINPQSCQVRLQYGFSLLNSSNLYLQNSGRGILKDTWICPFPKEIKTQIANL